MAGRKRKGTLVNYGGGWKARIANGPLIDLETKDRALAERKLAHLTGRDPGLENPAEETFKPASERIVKMLAEAGMVTAGERLSRLKRYAWPTVGDVQIRAVTPQHITKILAAAAGAGIAHDTLDHLRADLTKVFAELIRDEVLTANPAAAERIRMPRAPRDTRKRVLLTDEEFAVFFQHHWANSPPAPAGKRYARRAAQRVSRRQLALMALVTRAVGGMRPSDLHAWTWEDIDLAGWAWTDVPRAKTEHLAKSTDRDAAPRERLELPPVLLGPLREWHAAAGAPTTGAVFPSRQPSYARPLRRALLEAGLTRHELHHDTERTRATDFYSFRRAWASALAASGLNAQTAMRLTGHRNLSTHQRYDVRPVLEIPAGALPKLPEMGADFEQAMEAYQPPKSRRPAWPAAQTIATGRPEFYGTTIPTVDLNVLLAAKYARPHGDLNPASRRERPSADDAQSTIACQEETEMPNIGAVLRMFGFGTE